MIDLRTANHTCINAHFQGQTVEQARIALTHRRFVMQCRVRRKLVLIGGIAQIGIVILHGIDDIVVNRADRLIFVQSEFFPFVHQLLYFRIHVGFLGGSCIVVHEKRTGDTVISVRQ